MATEENQASDTVSVKAHERMTAERDDLKTQLADATNAIHDMTRLEGARKWFQTKGVTDADAKAELVMPHLRDVDPDKIGETLEQDRFIPLTQTAEATPPVEPEEKEPEALPPPQGFGGPSPAGDDKPPAQEKYSLRSPEVQELIRTNNRAALHKLYEEDRIAKPERNY